MQCDDQHGQQGLNDTHLLAQHHLQDGPSAHPTQQARTGNATTGTPSLQPEQAQLATHNGLTQPVLVADCSSDGDSQPHADQQAVKEDHQAVPTRLAAPEAANSGHQTILTTLLETHVYQRSHEQAAQLLAIRQPICRWTELGGDLDPATRLKYSSAAGECNRPPSDGPDHWVPMTSEINKTAQILQQASRLPGSSGSQAEAPQQDLTDPGLCQATAVAPIFSHPQIPMPSLPGHEQIAGSQPLAITVQPLPLSDESLPVRSVPGSIRIDPGPRSAGLSAIRSCSRSLTSSPAASAAAMKVAAAGSSQRHPGTSQHNLPPGIELMLSSLPNQRRDASGLQLIGQASDASISACASKRKRKEPAHGRDHDLHTLVLTPSPDFSRKTPRTSINDDSMTCRMLHDAHKPATSQQLPCSPSSQIGRNSRSPVSTGGRSSAFNRGRLSFTSSDTSRDSRSPAASGSSSPSPPHQRHLSSSRSIRYGSRRNNAVGLRSVSPTIRRRHVASPTNPRDRHGSWRLRRQPEHDTSSDSSLGSRPKRRYREKQDEVRVLSQGI